MKFITNSLEYIYEYGYFVYLFIILLVGLYTSRITSGISDFSSGIYIARMAADGFSASQKIMLIK